MARTRKALPARVDVAHLISAGVLASVCPRALIEEVRGVYSGLITYNCDKYQEDHVTWWDAVDVISSSGYYRSGDWRNQLDRIEGVVAREGKPFFFMEAGCPSREGSANAGSVGARDNSDRPSSALG